MSKIIILGINADIGFNIALKYLNDGFEVLGTFRSENKNIEILRSKKNISLVRCDALSKKDIKNLFEEVKIKKFKWTNIFSSIGSSEPIGNSLAHSLDTSDCHCKTKQDRLTFA